MLRIEHLVDERNVLGEGPLWDVAEQRLYWIDSYGKAVFRTDAEGKGIERWTVPEHIGSMCLRAGGGAVVSLRNGFHFLDFESGAVESIGDPEPDLRRTRLNDGKVDRQGRFLAGSMDYEERDPICGLYRLDADLKITKLESEIIVSNGPCWSPDGRIFYFADSFKRAIYAYDYDIEGGDLLSRRLFVSFEPLRGFPDGATVDEEGCVWSAEVFSGRLIRFTPDGVIDRIVGLPVSSTTSLTFGGANLNVAYVTSMGRPIGGVKPAEREAGGMFAIHGLGVRGLPEPRFKG